MGLEGCSYIANLKKMQIVEQNVMYNLICVKNKEYVSIKTHQTYLFILYISEKLSGTKLLIVFTSRNEIDKMRVGMRIFFSNFL